MENFAKNYKGSVIVISHDRYFLDNTVNKIFMMENGRLESYDGNYTTFMAKRKKDLEVRLHQYKSQQKEIERQEEIIDRLKNLGGSKRKRGFPNLALGKSSSIRWKESKSQSSLEIPCI